MQVIVLKLERLYNEMSRFVPHLCEQTHTSYARVKITLLADNVTLISKIVDAAHEEIHKI